MKTLEQVKRWNSETIDGRDIRRLAIFIPKEQLAEFKLELPEGAEHIPVPFTRENVLNELKEDVAFGFKKALSKRGISSSLMYQVVSMWNWILEEGLEDFDSYSMYGLPLFKATAIKYGFPNPIGDDTGSEDKYSE